MLIDVIGWSLKMIEVYIESNRKEWMMWKRLENSHHSIGRQDGRFKGFEHPKLFVHAFRISK